MNFSRAEISAFVVLLDETISEMEGACMREWVNLVSPLNLRGAVKFSRDMKMCKGDPKLYAKISSLQNMRELLIKKLEDDAAV